MMMDRETATNGTSKPRRKRLPDIKGDDFLSAVRLVVEKEGRVNTRLLREHFYRGYDVSAIERRLKSLMESGVLEKRSKGVLTLAPKPENGNGAGQKRSAVVLPPVPPESKAPPVPSGDNQPYLELRRLVAQAVERLEDFQERCQPLLAALLDLEKDMVAFERVVTILGEVKSMTLAGLKTIRR
jgi:hypothetical protein|uniref:Uncharacterized protein n=1 Tax=Desulfobacca acetoxidans TaxID=60893 RepID=A0A7C3V0Y4_9BACT